MCQSPPETIHIMIQKRLFFSFRFTSLRDHGELNGECARDEQVNSPARTNVELLDKFEGAQGASLGIQIACSGKP